MSLVVALVVISYLMFVDLSDQINPFTKVKSPIKKKKWRLGRAAALSSLIAGAIALWLLNSRILNEQLSIALYAVVGLVFLFPAIIKYKRSTL